MTGGEAILLVCGLAAIGLYWRRKINYALTHEPRPTLQECLEALRSGPLGVIPAPKNGWSAWPEATRVANERFSLFYFRTEHPNGKTAETIDFIIPFVRGGICITFIEGQIDVWTRNELIIPKPQFALEKDHLAYEVLEEARKAVKATHPYRGDQWKSEMNL